ncbi:MAG: hypothetical protein ACPKPY_03115 [Nitrososphaeraceae archaeon]
MLLETTIFFYSDDIKSSSLQNFGYELQQQPIQRGQVYNDDGH